MITAALARVAWPHRGTSVAGVNQRTRYSPSSGTRNAVSARLFSQAIACRTASAKQLSSGMTAAGFPVNTRLAKASAWNIRTRMSTTCNHGAPPGRLLRKIEVADVADQAGQHAPPPLAKDTLDQTVPSKPWTCTNR